jgi:hypothetical protein
MEKSQIRPSHSFGPNTCVLMGGLEMGKNCDGWAKSVSSPYKNKHDL